MIFTVTVANRVLTLSSCEERRARHWCAAIDGKAAFWGSLNDCREWFKCRAFEAIQPTLFKDRIELTDAIEQRLIGECRKWLKSTDHLYAAQANMVLRHEAQAIATRAAVVPHPVLFMQPRKMRVRTWKARCADPRA